MIKEQAIAWLDERPKVKELILGLERDGILEKMETCFHAYVGDIDTDIIAIADYAGFKTGRAKHKEARE